MFYQQGWVKNGSSPRWTEAISLYINDIFISATTIYFGKTNPSKKSKPWMTPHMQAKIRTWNRLHRTICQKRQEWINSCLKTLRLSTRPKQKVGKISFKTQWWIQTIQICRKSFMVWTVLLMPTHQTMSHNSYSITNIKSKANVFINYYTRVSKLNMSRVDWDLNRQFKKRLNVPSADDETCAPLQMGEVWSAIKTMKCKEAAGSDNITTSFLKSLSPLELQELLSMFNLSFSFAHCPCIWRVAIIIELLKVGKSPIEVASFCPVSLTSRIVKLLERIFADCLYYTAETKNLTFPNWGRSLTSLVSVLLLHKV